MLQCLQFKGFGLLGLPVCFIVPVTFGYPSGHLIQFLSQLAVGFVEQARINLDGNVVFFDSA